MALGMTTVVVTGGIDLSVGSVMGLAAIVAGLVLQDAEPWWLAMAAGLATGFAAGAVNGVLIAWLGLPPFVVTLGTLSIGRSLAVVLSQNKMIYDFGPDADTIFAIGGGQILGIANPVWVLLALTVVFAAVLHLTRWGRHLYAIGGNEQAARVSGINVGRYKILIYTYAGALSGLAGLVISSRIGSGQPGLGVGYELDAIAAAVIGGTSLSAGGIGTIPGTIAGALIIGVLNNTLDLVNVSAYWQQIIKGLIIVGAVVLDQRKNRGDR
jgi:ribose/xylose/arabinose/galactoside ABC-type transport system permease subunit